LASSSGFSNERDGQWCLVCAGELTSDRSGWYPDVVFPDKTSRSLAELFTTSEADALIKGYTTTAPVPRLRDSGKS